MAKKVTVGVNILSWITGEVIYESDKETIKEAVIDANLRNADLYGANLYGANLRGADLRNANLRGADLRNANLYGANLRGADLYGADLRNADLYGADLYGANLRNANLYGADLRNADLYGANLRNANLRGADLRNADLYGANLYGANLRGAKNNKLAVAMTRILPQGTIIGYKKCKNGVIVKLEIPAKAKRSHAFGRKCRAEYAKVLHIYGATEAYSSHDNTFKYVKGEIVRPKEPFSEEWTEECASGIHFYITREEAENHA